MDVCLDGYLSNHLLLIRNGCSLILLMIKRFYYVTNHLVHIIAQRFGILSFWTAPYLCQVTFPPLLVQPYGPQPGEDDKHFFTTMPTLIYPFASCALYSLCVLPFHQGVYQHALKNTIFKCLTMKVKLDQDAIRMA